MQVLHATLFVLVLIWFSSNQAKQLLDINPRINKRYIFKAEPLNLPAGGRIVGTAASRPPNNPCWGAIAYQDFGGSGGASPPTPQAARFARRREDSGGHCLSQLGTWNVHAPERFDAKEERLDPLRVHYSTSWRPNLSGGNSSQINCMEAQKCKFKKNKPGHGYA